MRMRRKKLVSLSMISVLALLSAALCGCTDISGTSSDSDSSGSASLAETAETLPEVEQNEAAEAAVPLQTEVVSENTEPVSESTDSSASEDESEASELVGNTGYTAAEWCDRAQAIYTSAAEVYYLYFCSSDGFSYDTEDTIGEGWYCVTSCQTMEEAVSRYYEIFSRTLHENDLNEQFQMVEDKLYRCCGDRGEDITYVSSQVTALTDACEDTLTFSVESTYQEPESTSQTVQTDVLTLVLEDGTWYVGQFTMPY